MSQKRHDRQEIKASSRPTTISYSLEDVCVCACACVVLECALKVEKETWHYDGRSIMFFLFSFFFFFFKEFVCNILFITRLLFGSFQQTHPALTHFMIMRRVSLLPEDSQVDLRFFLSLRQNEMRAVFHNGVH